MTVYIRPGTYKNPMSPFPAKDGYNAYGTDEQGRRIRIFTETLESAERIRDKVERGAEIMTEDFRP